ncbi:MAG TPA: ROK family protein, partial [Flavipsychrobacter sp.]
VQGGRKCGCGKMGCMERYCSATGIVVTANEWLEQRTGASVLRNIKEPLTAKHIHEAADAGDQLAVEIFEYTGMILGQALANAVAITSPQAIILFGGLAKSGDVLYEPTRKHMNENLLSVFRNTVEIIPSALPDADAAILGASALAW